MCRFNHLHPPFNNQKVRRAALAALPQEPFLRAQVGIKDFYHSCPSMFTCNTPYASAKGSDIQSKSSMKKAQELLKSSGYDGTPVVLMKPTDLDELEKLRDQFAREISDPKKKALAEDIQARAFEIGTHAPLGEYISPLAARKNVTGFVIGPGDFYWNLKKN